MPNINNTLASQGNGVYQHKSLRLYCVLGAKMCQKTCAKTCKNQNAEYITKNKSHYKERYIMYIKFLTAVKYGMYTVKRSARGFQTLKKNYMCTCVEGSI